VTCGLLHCAVTSDLDLPSIPLYQFLSENKCSPLFRSPIENPGHLTKDVIANDLDDL